MRPRKEDEGTLDSLRIVWRGKTEQNRRRNTRLSQCCMTWWSWAKKANKHSILWRLCEVMRLSEEDEATLDFLNVVWRDEVEQRRRTNTQFFEGYAKWWDWAKKTNEHSTLLRLRDVVRPSKEDEWTLESRKIAWRYETEQRRWKNTRLSQGCVMWWDWAKKANRHSILSGVCGVMRLSK